MVPVGRADGMSLRRLLPVTLAVAMCALVVAVLPTRGAGADVQSFSISVTGDAGNFFYDSSDANAGLSQEWYLTGYEHVGVSVTANTGDSGYSFDFATPKEGNQRFVTGFYQWAQDYPFFVQGRPGIAVHGNSPGCANQTGNFEVRDMARSELRITRLWLVWERWCGSAIGPSRVEFGELRLGYPQAAYDVSPTVVVWPWDTIYPGDAAPAVPVRVRLTSSDTVTADTPSVSGADASDFPIREQDCTGTLTASGCTVWVGFNPSAPGPRHATLTVPTSAGARSVSLDGPGALGTSEWNVTINHSNPPQTQQLVMRSASVGNPYEIRTQARESQPDGTDLLWNARFVQNDGTPFKVGTTYQYSSGINPPFFMSIAQGNAGCEINSGSATFNDLAYLGPDHLLDRMDANFYAACQSGDPWTVSARMRFHARSDINAPEPVTGLAAVRNGGNVTLTWTKPSASDLAGIIVRWYAATDAPSVWSAGNTAYLGTGSSASFAAPSTEPVSVSVWTWDTTGNVSPATSAYLAPVGDTVPPSGSVTINAGATYTVTPSVMLSMPASDAFTGVAQVRISNRPETAGGLLSYGSTRDWTAQPQAWSLADTAYGGSTTNGTRAVCVQFRDGAGNWSPVHADTIVLDTVAPAARAPAAAIASGYGVGSLAPTRLTWSATDATSGVAGYQIEQSTDGGAWARLTLASPLTTAAVRSLAAGHSYQYRTRAVDRAGLWSGWQYGPVLHPALYQETTTALAWSGTWSRYAVTGASGGYVRGSTQALAWARFTASARSVGWVAVRGPSRGKATVYVDGVLAGTVDLYASTAQPARIVFVRSWSATGTHAVTVRVNATAGRPRVEVDAFVLLR